MKSLLVITLLSLIATGLQAQVIYKPYPGQGPTYPIPVPPYPAPYPTPYPDDQEVMTPKQSEYLRYNGVSISIIRIDDRFLSKRATAYYEAGLSNPFNRSVRCNIELISSRGVNEDYEVIATKSHIGVYAQPRSVTNVSGNIEIKRGRGDDGLQWIESKGHLVAARNCMFVD